MQRAHPIEKFTVEKLSKYKQKMRIVQKDGEMVLRRTIRSFPREFFRIVVFISLILLMQLPCLASGMTNDENISAFDIDNMDRSIRPGDDFYRYVNGEWI